jgi:site-specific recombinase XerD
MKHVDVFIISRRALGLTPRTVAWYQWTLTQFATFVGDRTVDRDVCRQYIAELFERELSAYTIRNTVRVLKTFFGWCVAEGLETEDPSTRLVIPKLPKRVPRGITMDDFKKLVGVASVRDQAILLVLIDCGVRVSELCGMLTSEFELEARTIRVIGKGDKERFVFLSVATCEAIAKWLALSQNKSSHLFITEEGLPMQPNTVTQILRRLGKRAGITGRCNPHSFRHGFAREYLLTGGDLASLSSLLGHTDVRTTMVYSAFLTSELKEKHARHSPILTHNISLRN